MWLLRFLCFSRETQKNHQLATSTRRYTPCGGSSQARTHNREREVARLEVEGPTDTICSRATSFSAPASFNWAIVRGKENPFQEPDICSPARKFAFSRQSTTHSFLMLILDLPPTRGNSFRAVDSTHRDTDPCQMIHVCLANNQIFCLFRLTNLCPLPPPGKPTHTGQFMVLPFIFF